jgi:hypothetical protein
MAFPWYAISYGARYAPVWKTPGRKWSTAVSAWEPSLDLAVSVPRKEALTIPFGLAVFERNWQCAGM